jgi:hypothetical protein
MAEPEGFDRGVRVRETGWLEILFVIAVVVVCAVIAGASYRSRHRAQNVVASTPVANFSVGTSESAVLRVAPANGLYDGQSIGVRLSGWGSGTVTLSECASKADVSLGTCGGPGAAGGSVVVDGSGVGTGTMTVSIWAYGSWPGAPAQICATQCVLVARGNDGVGVSTPINFAG